VFVDVVVVVIVGIPVRSVVGHISSCRSLLGVGVRIVQPFRWVDEKLDLIGPILGLRCDEANHQGPTYRENGISETIIFEDDGVDETQQFNDKGG